MVDMLIESAISELEKTVHKLNLCVNKLLDHQNKYILKYIPESDLNLYLGSYYSLMADLNMDKGSESHLKILHSKASMLRTATDPILENLGRLSAEMRNKYKKLASPIIHENNNLLDWLEEHSRLKTPARKAPAPKTKSRLKLLGDTSETDAVSKSLKDLNARISRQKDQHLLDEERYEKKEQELTTRLEKLGARMAEMEGEVKERVEAVDSLYFDAKSKFEEDRKGIDSLLGKISEGAIARSYDISAGKEESTANNLRTWSFATMAVIAGVIAYSLYDSTQETFQWENALFRLVFTMLLSVPAAYLARESAKHRQQQYTHLQTSLDLKAIDPYLASLPETEQHRIKSEIANRIFAAKDHSANGVDPYPSSTHDLVMKLIDKLELKSVDKSAKTEKI